MTGHEDRPRRLHKYLETKKRPYVVINAMIVQHVQIQPDIECGIWLTFDLVLHISPSSPAEDDDENSESHERHDGDGGDDVENDFAETFHDDPFLMIWQPWIVCHKGVRSPKQYANC